MKTPWRGKTISNQFNQLAVSAITRFTSALAAFLLLIGLSTPALADSYDDQIAAMRDQAAQQQAQANALHNQANDYKSKVTELQLEISALQNRINIAEADYNRVSADVADNEAKLAEQKVVLSANIKSMYLDSKTTPLEMLASSKNFSDFLDQQQYQDKIKSKIQDAMAEIQTIQARLKLQQEQLSATLATQKTQQQQLNDTRSQMNQLLALAQQNATAADAQVKNSNNEVSRLKAEQAAVLAAASRRYTGTLPGASGGSGGACDNGNGNGGYPAVWCNASQDAIQTPWGLSRECVSWAGWRRSQMGKPNYGNLGNANTWDDYAPAGTVHSSPIVGAIAQTDRGGYGHVAVVEAVQGNSVVVSEMNYDNAGHYRTALYPTSFFEHYIW